MAVELTVEGFRAAYPAFADDTKYPDATVQAALDQTECMIKPSDCRTGSCTAGLYYMIAAHLLTVQENGTTGAVSSSTVDKVTVAFQTPAFGTSPFRYFMGLSPYGLQALALLKIQSGGMIGIGGSKVQAGFRKPTGGY